MREIILASSSVYRQQQLTQLGIDFYSIAADIDESAQPNEKPDELALRLSYAKALRIAERHPEAIVIGSDQTAFLDTYGILSKPGDRLRAIEQLTHCSGQTVTFNSAVCALQLSTGKKFCHLEPTEVEFRELTQNDIHSYIDKEQPFDAAGAFYCEGLGVALFKRISSHDNSALIGLPLIGLCSILQEFNIFPLQY